MHFTFYKHCVVHFVKGSARVTWREGRNRPAGGSCKFCCKTLCFDKIYVRWIVIGDMNDSFAPHHISQGAAGERGYEGIVGYQGVKVCFLPHSGLLLSLKHLLLCFYLEISQFPFLEQGNEGLPGAEGSRGLRGHQV